MKMEYRLKLEREREATTPIMDALLAKASSEIEYSPEISVQALGGRLRLFRASLRVPHEVYGIKVDMDANREWRLYLTYNKEVVAVVYREAVKEVAS